MVNNFLWVALGGALGSVLRMAVGLAISHKLPVATLVVNFVGSLVIGILIRNVEHGVAMHYFSVVGLCGGFTTFSTFSLDVMKLLKNGDTIHALLYMLVSLTVCVAAVAIGTKLKIQ